MHVCICASLFTSPFPRIDLEHRRGKEYEKMHILLFIKHLRQIVGECSIGARYVFRSQVVLYAPSIGIKYHF